MEKQHNSNSISMSSWTIIIWAFELVYSLNNNFVCRMLLKEILTSFNGHFQCHVWPFYASIDILWLNYGKHQFFNSIGMCWNYCYGAFKSTHYSSVKSNTLGTLVTFKWAVREGWSQKKKRFCPYLGGWVSQERVRIHIKKHAH